MKKLLFLFIMMLSPMLASADTVEIDGIYYNLTEETKVAEVTSNPQKYKGDIIIPASVEYDGITYKVKSIGGYAFYLCQEMTSVIIPNSVTTICNHAFDMCSGLTSVSIASSVTKIQDYAFFGCKSLTSVNIPNNVTEIGQGTFWECSGLKSIIVEKENKVYDSREECNAIIKTSDNELIFGCMNTTIPNSVTKIGSRAFFNCISLVSVTIPNSVTSIETFTFRGCTGLTSVNLPNSLLSIGAYAFQGCSGLTSIDIPNSVTNIEEGAFSDCKGLSSLIIPNSVTTIGVSAFRNCTGLTSVNLPNSLPTIGGYAFQGCSGLTFIDIPNSVTSIGQGAFSECSGLTSFTIPNSVTSIASGTFSFCSNLTSISIPHTVTSIGNRAFMNCTSLTSITIPDLVTSIEYETFYGCSSLTSITIPNSVTTIGQNAFCGCKGMISFTIPNSVTYIDQGALADCTSLTSITIPNSVTKIQVAAFSGCNNLTTVVIPSTLTNVRKWTFRDCTKLKDIYCWAENAPSTEVDVFQNSNIGNATLHVPAASISAYQATEPWSNFKEIVALTDQDDQEEPSDYIPFVEEGKQWHMVSTSLTQYMLSDYILVNEEVVKNGKTYLRMYSRKDDMTSIHNMGLFREEDRKVYFLHPDKQEEFLIFDYSLKIGDTYETYSYDEQKMVSYKVMSIDDCLTEPEIIHYDYDQAADSMITHRRYLRKWTVCRTDNDLEKTWIEGIGSFSGPLENLYDANAISSRSILAYVDYVGENAFINPYLPFSFYDNFSGLVHGCHLPTSIIENPGSNRHSQLTYELEGNRLHVYGQIVSSCGNSYVYIIEEPTDDPLVRKLHFEKRDVEPVPTCVNLYATNFYVPGFYPNMNYIVVDNDGEEHPVINKTPQTAYRPMIEEGKVWTVGIENSGNPVQIVEYYYFDGDTIIDGKTCKQMMCQQNISLDYPDYNNMSQSPSLTKVGAWYEENKKVYFYDEKQQYMRMMYDFSVDANDTLYLINDYLPFVIGPKQTGGIKGFKGVYRDVTMGPNAISTIWLEGVGGIDGPTINAYPEAVDHSKFLMSCTVGDEVIYLNDEYEDWTTYESAEARKNRFDFTHTIKTNPKARRRSGEDPLYGEYNDLMLGIKLDPLDDAYLVRITDESGKVVYEKAINAGNIVALSIDISTYAKGHYTITLENSNESFTGEFEAQKTGIKGVIKNNEERKYYIYNLHGQRLSSLQKGLNIVNGQKIYVK